MAVWLAGNPRHLHAISLFGEVGNALQHWKTHVVNYLDQRCAARWACCPKKRVKDEPITASKGEVELDESGDRQTHGEKRSLEQRGRVDCKHDGRVDGWDAPAARNGRSGRSGTDAEVLLTQAAARRRVSVSARNGGGEANEPAPQLTSACLGRRADAHRRVCLSRRA